MESQKHFGTQWCPQSALSSNFFWCDEERTLKISSEFLCDGFPDCPISSADESRFVCSREELRLMTSGLSFCLYLVGFCSAAYLLCCRSSTTMGQRIAQRMLTDSQKNQLAKTLKLVCNFLKEPITKNERDMASSIDKIKDKKQLMTLLKVVHNVEIKTQGTTTKMFEPTVEKMFVEKSRHKTLFNLVKGCPYSSNKMKTDVLQSLEPKGYLGRLRTAVDEKLAPKTKITLTMVVELVLATLGLLFIFVHETKDILTILSIKTFHEDVIQGRVHLIDNMPLMDFVTILSAIYGFTFLIKLLNAVANASTTPEGEAHSCHIDVFKCRLNPYWFPFVAELVLGLQGIQRIMRNYKSKLAMNEAVEQLEAIKDKDEEVCAWKKIVDIAQDIDQVDVQREALGEKRKKIKIVSCNQAVQKNNWKTLIFCIIGLVFFPHI